MLGAMFGRRNSKPKNGAEQDFHRDSAVIEQHLKLAIQAESENGTRLRAELEELRRMQQQQAAESEKKMRELGKAKKDNDVLRQLVKGGSEGHQQVLADLETMRFENEALQEETNLQKQELANMRNALAKEQAEAEAQRIVLEGRIKKLIEEKTRVETQCASAQLRQLDQNFSAKDLPKIDSEIRSVFTTSFALGSLHKVKSMNVTDMESNLIYSPDSAHNVETSVKHFLIALGGRVDGPDMAKKIQERIGSFIDEKGGRDPIKGTLGLLKNVVGEESKTVFVLRAAANQSIIAPVSEYLAATLTATGMPFKQVKGEWKITVTLGERVLHVTHRKKEECTQEAEDQIGHFSFRWQMDVTLDPMALEMRSFEVQLTDLKVTDQKQEAHVRTSLSKAFAIFQPKQNVIRIPVAVSAKELVKS